MLQQLPTLPRVKPQATNHKQVFNLGQATGQHTLCLTLSNSPFTRWTMASKAHISQRARLSYIALYSIRRTFVTSTASASSSRYHPSDFTGGPFTGSYEPGLPTSGPLGEASILGAPRLTPKVLKQHLDQFVVGQERAKRQLCVAIYNHYQRIQELRRRDEQEEELAQQQARKEMARRHPFEGKSGA